MPAPEPSRTERVLLELGPLPLQGRAWPKWVAILAVLVLALIGVRFILLASSEQGQAVHPMMAGSLLLLFAALIVIAYYMCTAKTTITDQGIEQQWILRREIRWEEIHFAKFIPLFGSKRLICFTHRGRPRVFQAADQHLQIAFAKISLAYQRRP